MPKIRRFSGGVPGKAWGNALGGFANQPRIQGRFATTSQVKAFAKIKRRQKIGKAFNKATVKMGVKGASAHKSVGATVTGGVIASAFVANKLNPSLSVSRKRVQASIRPDVKIGPFHAYTSHAIGIERRGNDFIDDARDKARRKASSEINRVTGGGVKSQFVHGVAGLPNYSATDGPLKVDGKIGNPRLRYSGKARPVPGAPASSAGGKTAAKPQGKRQGAKTITNATKGSGGAVRPQRRGGGKKRKKAKK